MNQNAIDKIEEACNVMPVEECKIPTGGTCRECMRDCALKIYENNKESKE